MARILIFDDSQELLQLLSFILTNQGHEVQTAHTADTFTHYINSFVPEIILLDVILNGVNGRRICSQIKSSEIGKQLAIILMSASPAMLHNYTSCNADDILEKPFDVSTIYTKINQQIERRN